MKLHPLTNVGNIIKKNLYLMLFIQEIIHVR